MKMETPLPSTSSAVWERVAFGWCKVATMLLLTAPLGRFALPVVALLTSALFVGAYVRGARESRCILKRPLLIAAFWGIIGAVLLWRQW